MLLQERFQLGEKQALKAIAALFVLSTFRTKPRGELLLPQRGVRVPTFLTCLASLPIPQLGGIDSTSLAGYRR